MHKFSATVKRNVFAEILFGHMVLHGITFFSLDHNVRKRRSARKIMGSRYPNEVQRVRSKDQTDPKLTPN